MYVPPPKDEEEDDEDDKEAKEDDEDGDENASCITCTVRPTAIATKPRSDISSDMTGWSVR